MIADSSNSDPSILIQSFSNVTKIAMSSSNLEVGDGKNQAKTLRLPETLLWFGYEVDAQQSAPDEKNINTAGAQFLGMGNRLK